MGWCLDGVCGRPGIDIPICFEEFHNDKGQSYHHRITLPLKQCGLIFRIFTTMESLLRDALDGVEVTLNISSKKESDNNDGVGPRKEEMTIPGKRKGRSLPPQKPRRGGKVQTKRKSLPQKSTGIKNRKKKIIGNGIGNGMETVGESAATTSLLRCRSDFVPGSR